jgi:hypothetical protein
MESVLANLNVLNRSLEGVVAVGKEFESVSALWGKFYTDVNRPGSKPNEQATKDVQK